MRRTVLNVDRVGKCYVDYGSNLKRFASWFGIDVPRKSEYWAVRDVSFNLDAGETLGVIGQNGAGKSTLLKLITGTVRPTKGTVAVAGRVSAILELGLGFNPEFSGRQNIYQAGGLMGLSERELTERMPEIEDFAELGEFFDHPLRTYSSGMQARLAFSLATAVRPDLLIVDEILSVGDSYFQHKSFDRIRRFKEQGTSIVLVTHALGDVRVLCNRVLLLDKGAVVKDGVPDEVVDYYNAVIKEKEDAKISVEQRRSRAGWIETKSGSGEIKAIDIRLVDAETQEVIETVRVGQRVELHLVSQTQISVPKLVVGIMFRDRLGNVIWGTNTWFTKQIEQDLAAGETVNFIPKFSAAFGPGSYSVTFALVSSQDHLKRNYEWHDNALVFSVVNFDRPFFVGLADIPASIEIVREPSRNDPNYFRVDLTTSCRDSDAIPKVSKAGEIFYENGRHIQLMHNGLKVIAGGYQGDWMIRVIRDLRGHHEPQEEVFYDALLRHVRPNSLIVELGCFWAYYSLWYLLAVPGSQALCVEPNPEHLEIGRQNAALNSLSDRVTFVIARAGNPTNTIPTHEGKMADQLNDACLDMSAILHRVGGRRIELLHMDIQGAETDFISSMAEAVKMNAVRFLIVSTHDRVITGAEDSHQKCLEAIRSLGGLILAEHSVEESFRGNVPIDVEVGGQALPALSR